MPFPIIPGCIDLSCEPVPPEPSNLVAGDTLSWERGFEDYPAAAGWTLSYVLNNATARFVVSSADITAEGDDFQVTIPSAETKTWTPGEYQWLAIVQLAAAVSVPAQRFTVALGRVIISVDLLDATAPQDTRSQNEISLANIEAQLGGRAGDAVQEYTINGRMLRRYGIPELLQLRSLFKKLVRQERIDAGEVPLPTMIAVHF